MKKIILLVAVFGMMASSNALAAHKIFNADQTVVLIEYTDEQWASSQAVNNSAEKLPIVLPGNSVVDQGGLILTCPVWFPQNGCGDNTKTEKYINSMIGLGKDLINKGLVNQFQSFKYWIYLAK